MLREDRSNMTESKEDHLVNAGEELGKVLWGKVVSELGLEWWWDFLGDREGNKRTSQAQRII